MFDFVRVYISLESFPTFATTLSTMRLASLARRSFLKSGIQFNGKINLATRVDSRMHHQFTGSSQGGACTAALLSVPRSPTTSEVFPPGDSKSAHTLALSGTELALVDDHRTSQAAAAKVLDDLSAKIHFLQQRMDYWAKIRYRAPITAEGPLPHTRAEARALSGPACSELLEMFKGVSGLYPLPTNSSLQKRHLLQYLEVSPLPV
ncbi:hypothetical protein CPB85DRAFT_1523914 [Mucidula mucida]|nr:hypothetical protein CPB85DRAFT_1523914 [Mucidula mucida]